MSPGSPNQGAVNHGAAALRWLRAAWTWFRRGLRRRRYGFRIGFDLAGAGSVHVDGHELVLRAHDGEAVTIRAALPDLSLKESTYLILDGVGYRDEHSAASRGEYWRDVISRGFAAVGLHADFGDRRSNGLQISPTGAVWLASMFGTDPKTPIVAEVSGVMTYPEDAKPKFIRMRADGVVGKSADTILKAIVQSEKTARPLSEAERIAFDLYSASFFQDHASDGRFLMLMMALETLIETEPRSQAVRDLLDRWAIEASMTSGLSADEVEGLVNALQSLHHEAIGRAGRRLADRLDPARYGGKRARRFFADSYRLRSKLVHGQAPRPAWDVVNSQTSELERFVADLLSQ